MNMRRVIVALLLAAFVFPACRRKPAKAPSAAEAFTAPPPPGEEEKWTEPEPEKEAPPPEPPPPPEPTSPPPEHALGFTFGETKTQTMRHCTKRGTWGKKQGNYYCSRAVDGAEFPGKPILSFCGDDPTLCAVGVAIEVDTSDWAAWSARFEEMKQALVTAHGAPTVDTQTVDEACKGDEFVKCLDDGTASLEATWKWKQGHRVSLTMSKKKSGDGPSAIRFVSIVGG